MTVERMLPLYEAKMIHQFDHRWATYGAGQKIRDVTLEEKQDPDFQALPRYWVREEVVDDRLSGRWEREWLLGWRDICRSTDERTMISSTFPTTAVGHTLPLAFSHAELSILAAIWTSFVFDFVARQKVGGTHMTYGYLTQLATLPPDVDPPWVVGGRTWIRERSNWLMAPQSWLSPERPKVRCDLDACFFHLYGVNRGDVDYILDTFPIVKRNDEAKFGTFRTKDLILEIYDLMQRAIETGEEYEGFSLGAASE